MPTYTISAPDGNTYSIQGPEGATQEQVKAEVLRQHPNAGRSAQQSEARRYQGESYMERVSRTSRQLDTALGRGPTGYAKAAVGAVEDAVSIGTGIAGDIAGAATALATRNPEKGKAVQKAMTYQPRTAGGKAGLEYVGALTQPLGALVGYPAKALEEHGFPIAAQTVNALFDLAPGVKGPMRAVAHEAKTAAQTIAWGYHLRPTDMGGSLTARAMEGIARTEKASVGISSVDKVTAEFSVKNQKVTTARVAEQFGLPSNTRFTPQILQSIEAKAKNVYKVIGGMGQFQVPSGARMAILNVGKGLRPDPQIVKLQQKFGGPVMNAADALNDIDELRAQSKASFKAGNKKLGSAQWDIAKTLETVLQTEAYKRSRGLGTSYEQARATLAQVHIVRRALIVSTGDISAARLARAERGAMERGHSLLTGNLKMIADTAMKYPEVMQDGAKFKGASSKIPLGGLGLAAVEAGLNHPGYAAATLAVMASRPPIRKALGSRTMQKSMAAKGLQPKRKGEGAVKAATVGVGSKKAEDASEDEE